MIIEIQNPDIEAKILAQAQARGMSVEAFLASLIKEQNGIYNDASDDRSLSLTGTSELGDDEFIQEMESMGADVHPLPRDFSREDIYFPRD